MLYCYYICLKIKQYTNVIVYRTVKEIIKYQFKVNTMDSLKYNKEVGTICMLLILNNKVV